MVLPTTGDSDVVLLTGYPRMITRLVAQELLARAHPTRIHLLVRAKFRESAQAFVKTLPAGSPVEIIEGDTAAIDMGLSGEEFRTLTASVTHIQHHAQYAYEGADSQLAREVNVRGAREVIEFARHARKLTAVVHHSSARVAGDREGIVFEDELEHGQKFSSDIARSQFDAERIMHKASAQLPIITVRPSSLVGHSVTGETDRLDGPYMLILLIVNSPVEIPLPATGNAPLQLVPVDYVARASVALMSQPKARGRTFHLVDPAPLAARRVFELVAGLAGKRLPRGFIPVNITRALLRTPGLERFVKSPRAFLEQLATTVTYDTRNTQELLVPLGIVCPPVTSYLDSMVTFVREKMVGHRSSPATPHDELTEDPLF